jgi:hypothetical protein
VQNSVSDIKRGAYTESVRFEVFTAATVKNGVLRRLLVTASVVPSSPILDTLMKEALSSSETSVLTRTTRRNILRVFENRVLRRIFGPRRGNVTGR